LQGHPLNGQLIGLAFELLQKVDRRLQCPSAACGLSDPVIEMTYFVDDRVSLRAELLTGSVNADSSELDAQPDLVLLREGLRHARVPDQSKPQRACQRRRLARNRSVMRVHAEASALECYAQLSERLRPESGD